jgi:hypothetical protein
MQDEWIATQWMRESDFRDFDRGGIAPTITLSNSPFYEGDRYAVRRGGCCLTKRGDWIYEPMPSSRTQAFYKRCRFDTFDAALVALAKAEKAREAAERRALAARGNTKGAGNDVAT